jgi:hypothetical protein
LAFHVDNRGWQGHAGPALQDRSVSRFVSPPTVQARVWRSWDLGDGIVGGTPWPVLWRFNAATTTRSACAADKPPSEATFSQLLAVLSGNRFSKQFQTPKFWKPLSKRRNEKN